MKKIKLFDPIIDENEIKQVVKTIKSKFWASGSGSGNVLIFENKFKKYIGSDSCVAVNSGTSALNLALSLIDIKNKEVILPSLSFVSTANSILLNGGIPKFVEINPKTMCVEPGSIKQAITRKTKVILPVHFGGFPCRLDEIKKIARKNNCFVIDQDENLTEIPKATRVPVTKGKRILLQCGGGGGYGDPKEREHTKVLDDLKQGYISKKYVKQHYPNVTLD